jgi:hypothetical protein
MVVDNDQLLTWSRVANNRRPTVTSELFPGGLGDLNDYSADDIRDAVKNFRSHPTANQRFNVSAHTTKRLVQLTLWVKDKIRVGHDATFPNGTTQAQFVVALEEAQQRDKIRQERKKNAEGLSTLKIDPALKSSAGWDGWTDATKAALSIAYGSKGVPLLYVIRTNDAPRVIFDDVDEHGNIIVPTWEEVAIEAAPLTGLDYEADRKTVHSFILNNVDEDSDAHAYVYPLVSKNDGRRDWRALENRYENEATIQARVNQANKTWDMLVYKNERAMPFEAFCRKLTKSLQHFEKAGRAKHDGDVIDWIWGHIQNTELSQHLSALKVAQSFAVKTSRQILQEIAKEIPNIAKGSNFQPRISGVHQNEEFTFDGDMPSNGVHTSDGKLFCGSYPHKRWWSDELKPYRDQITSLRDKHDQNGKGPNKNGDDGKANQGRNAKRKLQALEKQNEELKRNLSALKSNTGGGEDKGNSAKDDNAGDAFGGKNSMAKKKDGEF